MNDLKVLAQPHRLHILRLIWEEEMSAGEIADRFPVSFGAISQHLKVLRDAGMVRVRPDGNRRHYRADRDRLGPLLPALEMMWESTLDELVEAVERGDRP